MKPRELSRPRLGNAASLGACLRSLRERRGWTQEELANAVSGRLSSRTIRNLERGQTRPYFYTLVTVLDTLDVPTEQRAAILDLWHAARAVDQHPLIPGLPGDSYLSLSLPALAIPLTPLIGRRHQEAAVAHLLRRGQDGVAVRLLTLTGAGGAGKTRLALQAAAGLGDEFVDGVAFVSLAALRDPNSVPDAIARTLGWDDAGDAHPTAWLTTHLRNRRLLLVLDNCEQVREAGPVLVALLEACPRLAALVTSRAPFRVRGEYVLTVPPLAVPMPGAETNLDQLGQVDAVAMFVQRARCVRTGFQIEPANAAIIAEICRRLDGLPLALELAAVLLAEIPADTLLRQLEHRLATLVDGARDLPDRQQTLRAALTWSYDLLSPADRILFRQLAVFVNGWTLDAAQALNGPQELADQTVTVQACLGTLVDHNLLGQAAPSGESAEEPARYSMLETIREYSLDLLAAHAEDAGLRQRHAAYYLAFVEDAGWRLTGADRGVWLRRLDLERDNIQAARDWFQETSAHASGLRLAGGLIWYWYFLGFLGEGYRWLTSALASGGASDDDPTILPARARALWGAGRFSHLLGDEARASLLLGESVAIWRRLDDPRGLAYALTDQGQATFFQGDPDTALAGTEESMALFQISGDRWGLALAMQHLARVVRGLGDDPRAAELYRAVLAIHTERGDPWGRAMPLLGLGRLAQARGALAEARAALEESLRIFQRLGEKRMAAMALSHLGLLAHQEGDALRVIAFSQQAIVLRQELGQWMSIGTPLAVLAGVARARGDLDTAARLGGAAEALIERRGAIPAPRDQKDREALLGAVRKSMNDGRLLALWREGRTLGPEQMAALALAL